MGLSVTAGNSASIQVSFFFLKGKRYVAEFGDVNWFLIGFSY